jgi:DNA repair protein RadD
MLRPYQQAFVNRIFDAWDAGRRNVLGVKPTGAGKTKSMAGVFLRLLADGFRGLAIAHRQELVCQISMAMARDGIDHAIMAPEGVIRWILDCHVEEFGRTFYHPRAPLLVAGIDTLIRRQEDEALKHVTHWCIDEAHHLLADNKWGRGVGLLPPGARGLGVTATPMRADKRALGREKGGLMDELIVGPTMRWLIDQKYLCEYRIYGLPQKIDLKSVKVGASGEFNGQQLRDAAHESAITGDLVEHYKRLAPGKPGVTFAVDIEIAHQHAQAYIEAGIPACVISSETPAAERARLIGAFRLREFLQVVNVDVLGEGFDCPGIEVVSMARPTASYGLYVQQFGRALRTLEGKTHGIILDHVGNVQRHGLPDSERAWTLEGNPAKPLGEIPLRVCANKECMLAFNAFSMTCPYCGHKPEKLAHGDGRVKPEMVEGNLLEYDARTLAEMRGESARIMGEPQIPYGASPIVAKAVANKWEIRRQAQTNLREEIAWWAGYQRDRLGLPDEDSYIKFWRSFGMDVEQAKQLPATKAHELAAKLRQEIGR